MPTMNSIFLLLPDTVINFRLILRTANSFVAKLPITELFPTTVAGDVNLTGNLWEGKKQSTSASAGISLFTSFFSPLAAISNMF